MTGWKTKLAGVAAMLTGAGAMLHAFSASDWGGVFQGWLILVGGLGALGIGHKLDKATAALKVILPQGNGTAVKP